MSVKFITQYNLICNRKNELCEKNVNFVDYIEKFCLKNKKIKKIIRFRIVF